MVDQELAHALVVAQFPHWSQLRVEPVHAFGTDHVIYRLGDRMALRFPRRASAVATMASESTWLPFVAPSLPVAVPVSLGRGVPQLGYPWPWSVCAWVEGTNPIAADRAIARDLGGFIRALRAVEVGQAPRAGEHNHWRGAPLSHWERRIEERLCWIADDPNIAAIRSAWDADRQAAPWDGVPRFIHGDLSAGNVLVRDGRLSGVIDWSCLGTGDPACELQVAWTLFDDEGRRALREELGDDDATWIRGRAWGLAMGVLNVSYYRTRNPAFAEQGQRAIDAVLADRA